MNMTREAAIRANDDCTAMDDKQYATSVKPTYATEAESAAYDRGYNHGHGIACHNVPTLGDTLRTEDLGRVTVDADNIREIHAAACIAAADNSRCFSPFEFIAHEFNLSDDSEALWKAFEQGTSDAISDDLSTYTDEDYVD